jgi:hypothetical protein
MLSDSSNRFPQIRFNRTILIVTTEGREKFTAEDDVRGMVATVLVFRQTIRPSNYIAIVCLQLLQLDKSTLIFDLWYSI